MNAKEEVVSLYNNEINQYYNNAHLIVMKVIDMGNEKWDSNFGLYVRSIVEGDIPELSLKDLTELENYEVIHECNNYGTSKESNNKFKNQFTIIWFVKPIERK